jgi:hypothetical protein
MLKFIPNIEISRIFILLGLLLFYGSGFAQLSTSPCPPPNPCNNNNCPSIPPANFPGPADFSVSNSSPNINQAIQVQVPSQQSATSSGAGCNNALINGLNGTCSPGNNNITTCRTFNWNFGPGATPATATGLGPHNVSWPTCGTKTVTLTVCEHRPNGSAITDGNNCCAAGGKAFNVYVSGTPGALTAAQASGMSAQVNLPYPVIPSFTYDLRLYLVSPDCKILRLAGWSGYCGSQGGYNATFQDGAGGPQLWNYSGGCAPYTGTYPPVANTTPDCGITPTITNFAGFAGSPATGTWKFLILDGIGGGNGYLQSASINIPGFTTTNFTSSTTQGAGPNTQWGPAQTCSYTHSVTVNVGGGPAMANFTAPAGPLCAGGPQQTMQPDGGGAAGVTYTWNFDAGANPQQNVTSSGPHTINVNWTTPGTKTITLTADGGGPACTYTQTATVVVNPPPQPALSAAPATVCHNQSTTISITTPTSPNNTYTWAFDGGSQNPATTNGTGPYQVTWANNSNPPTASIKTVSLTEVSPGCGPATTTITVTVNPVPIPQLQATGPVCTGIPATVSFTGQLGPNGPHVYTWNCDNCTSTPTTQGPHQLVWNNPGAKTVTLSVSSAGCASLTTASVEVVVNPYPVPTVTIADPERCEGQTTQISFTGTPGSPPTTFSWSCDGCVGIADPATQGPHIVSWANHGIKTVSLQVTSSGCSATGTAVITINRVPNALFSVNPTQICANNNAGPFNVTMGYGGNAGSGTGATSATFAWNCNGCDQAPLPNTAGPFTINWATSGTKTLTLQVTNNPGGCTSPVNTVLVTVHPVPVPPTVTNVARCGPGPIDIPTTVGANGNVVRWYTTPGAIAYFYDQNDTLTTTINTTTVYYVSSYNSNTQCESNRVPVTATVNIVPGAPSAVSPSRCGPGDVTFTATNGIPPGDELAIFDVPSGGVALVSSTVAPFELVVPNLSTTTQFYLQSKILATGCTTRVPVIAVVHPIPGLPVSRDEYRCDPGTVNFFVAMGPFGAQANLYKQAVGGSPIDVDFTSPFMVTTPHLTQTDSFWISAYNSLTGCESARIKYTAFVYITPQAPSAPNLTRCGTGDVIFTANSPTANTHVHLYTQSAGGNPIAVSEISPYELRTPTVTQTTTFWIQSIREQTLCVSPRVPVVVTVNPKPKEPEVSNTIRCGPGSVSFSVTPLGIPQADSVVLHDEQIGGNVLATDNTYPFILTTPPIFSTTTFYVSGVDKQGGCSSERVPVVAHIFNQPAPPIANTVSRCGPGAVELTAAMGIPAGSDIALYTQATGGVPILVDNAEPFRFILDNVSQTSTYYLSSRNQACESDRTPVVVEINPRPEPPVVMDASRCGEGEVNFTAQIGGGANIVLLYNGQGAIISSDAVAPYEVSTGPLSLSSVFYASNINSATGCESFRMPVNAIIHPIPGLASSSPVSRCAEGPVTFTVRPGTPTGNMIAIYSAMQGGTLIAATQVAPYELTVPMVTTHSTYYIEVTNTATGCIGNRVGVVATINPNPAPAVPLSDNIRVCGEGAATFTAEMGAPPGDQIRLFSLPSGGDPIAVDDTPPYTLATPVVSISSIFYLESYISGTGCASVRVPVQVTVITPPDPPSAPGVVRCGPGMVTFSASMGAVSGNRIELYTQALATIPYSVDSVAPYELTTLFITTTQYFYLNAKDQFGCSGPRRKVLAEINEIPGMPEVGGNNRCGPGPVTLTVLPGFPLGNEMRVYDAPSAGSLLLSDNTSPYQLTLPNVTTNAIYFVSSRNNNTGCESQRKAVSVNINAIPGPPQAQDVARCGIGPIQFTGLMTPPEGNLMRLYTAPLGGAPIDEDFSSPFYLRVPSLTTTLLYYLESVNTITGCVSERTPVAGVMHPLPSPPQVPQVARCGVGEVTFTATMGQTLGDIMLLYSGPSETVSITSDPIAPYLLKTPTLGQSTTFYVAAKNLVSGCESPRTPAVAIVDAVPAAPVVGLVSRCGPGSLDIPVNPNGLWGQYVRLYSVPSGGTVIDEDFGPHFVLQTPVIGSNTTYYITVGRSGSNCESPRTPVTATIKPVPGAPIAADLARCGSGNVTFSASMSGVAGTEIRLYDTPEALTPLAVDATSLFELTTPSVTQNRIYYLASFNAITGCESPRKPVMVTINPIPAEPIVTDFIRCGPGSATFAPKQGNPAGNQILLYKDVFEAQPLLVDSDAPYELAIPNITSTTLYYVSSKNAVTGCESPRTPVRAIVAPIPAPPLVEPESRCGTGRVTFFVGSNAGTSGGARLYDSAFGSNLISFDDSYPWELVTQSITASSQTVTRSYYISRYDIETGCESERVVAQASVFPKPSQPIISGGSRCGAGIVAFSATMGQQAGDEVRLYGDPITTEPLQKVSQAPYVLTTPVISTSAVYYIAAYNTQTGCASDLLPVNAVINALPGTPVVPNVRRCGQGTVAFSPIMGAPAGNRINMYNSPVGGAEIAFVSAPPYTLITSTITTSTSFYFSSKDEQSGCESPRTLASVEIATKPDRPVAADVRRCGEGEVVITASMGAIAGNDIRLYTVQDGGSAIAIDNNSPFELATPSFAQSGNLYIEAVTEGIGCASERTPVFVTILPLPGRPSASGIDRCGNGQATITAQMGAPEGAQLELYSTLIGGEAISADNNPPYELITPVISSTTTFYVASKTNAGCASPRFPVVVRVNLVPGIPEVNEASRCGPGAVVFTAKQTAPAGSGVRLYNVPVGGFPLAENTAEPYNLTTPSINVHTTFYVEAYDISTGCVSARQPAFAKINPVPGLPTSATVGRCGSGSVWFTGLLGVPAGNVLRLYANAVGIGILAETSNSPFILETPEIETTTKFYLAAYNSVTKCESPRLEVTAVVNQNPGQPLVGDQTRCGPGPVSFTAMQGIPAGNQLRIYSLPQEGVPVNIATTEPYTLYIPFVNSTSTYYIESYNSLTGCVSPRKPILITIEPQPGQPLVQTAPRCGSGVVTFSVLMGTPTGNTLSLFTSAQGGSAISVSTSNPAELYTPFIVTTSTFYIESRTNAGCVSPRVEVVAEVKPLPSNPLVNDAARCGRGSHHFTAFMTGSQGTEVRLYTAASAANPEMIDFQSPFHFETPEVSATRTYFFSVYDGQTGCESQRVGAIASVLPLPGTPDLLSPSRCGVGSVIISAQMGTPPGNLVALYRDNTSAVSIAEDATPPYALETPVLQTTTTFYLESVNTVTGCSSQRVPITVTIHPRPGAPTAANAARCGAGSLIFNAEMAAPAGNQIRLFSQLVGGELLSVAIVPPYQVNTPAIATTTTFYIESYNSQTGCSSARREVTATVNPLPGLPDVTDVSRCGEGSVALTASMGNPPGTRLHLYDSPVGGSILAQTSQAPYILNSPGLAGSTALYVAAYDATTGCEGNRRRVGITIHPTPPTPVAPIVNRCGPGMVTFTINQGVGLGQEVRLYAAPQGGSLLDLATPAKNTLTAPSITQTSTFYIESYNTATGCASARVPVIAKVDLQPGVLFVENASRCGAGNLTLTLVMGEPAGEQIQVFTQPVGGSIIASLNYPPYLYVSGNLQTTTVFYVQSVQGTCASPRVPVTATIYPKPITPTISQDGPKCPGELVSLNAAGTSGAQYYWNGPANFTATGPTVARLIDGVEKTGVYSVYAVIGNCSSETVSIRVGLKAVLPNPIARFSAEGGQVRPLCVGENFNLSLVNITEFPLNTEFEWTGPSFYRVTGTSAQVSVQNVTLEQQGVYYVKALLEGCTTNVGSVNVDVIPLPELPVVTNSGPVCQGQLAQLFASAVGNGVYTWIGPNGYNATGRTVSVSGIPASAGVYSLSYTSPEGCKARGIATTRLEVRPIPAMPSLRHNSPLCEGETLELIAIGPSNTTWLWEGPGGWNGNSGAPSIKRSPLALADSGLYRVRAIVNGCTSAFASGWVSVRPRPGIPSLIEVPNICAGGSATLRVRNPEQGATFVWNGPAGFSATGSWVQLDSVTSAMEGIYTVAPSFQGCKGLPASTTIIVKPVPPAPSPASNAPLCAGQTLKLSADGAENALFVWRGPEGFMQTGPFVTRDNINASSSGAYSVVAIVAGCTSAESILPVRVKPIPAAPTATNNGPRCVGDWVQLTASGGADGVLYWRGPNGMASVGNQVVVPGLTAASAGAYSVIYVVEGCTSLPAITVVEVKDLPSPPLVASDSPRCVGDALQLTANSALGATYRWIGPSGLDVTTAGSILLIPSVSSSHAGVYSVVAVVEGCTSLPATLPVTISPMPLAPRVNANTPLCVGQNLNLNIENPAPAMVYEWKGPNGFLADGPFVNRLITGVELGGSYSVRAKVGNCYSPEAIVPVEVISAPEQPVILQNSPVCAGQTITLTAEGNYPNNVVFDWEGPGGFFANGKSVARLANSVLDGGIYSVTARLGNCRSNAGVANITVQGIPPTPAILSNAPVCAGQALRLTAETIPGATYYWNGPNGFSSTEQMPSIPNATLAHSGVYELTIAVGSCQTSTFPLNVVILPRPSLAVASSNGPVCTGRTLQLFATNIPGAQYFWEGPSGFFAAEQNPFISEAQLENSGQYSVRAIMGACTSEVSVVSVTVRPTPATPNINTNAPICVGGNLQLNASAVSGASYQWSGPNGYVSAIQNPVRINVGVGDAGSYSVRTIMNGCTSAAAVANVEINPTPIAPPVGNNGPVCAGQTLQLTSGPVAGATYEWSGPQGFTSTLQNPTISGISTAQGGTYNLVVRLGTCTSTTARTTVQVRPSADVEIFTNAPLCTGQSLAINATPIAGAVYRWVGPNNFVSDQREVTIASANTIHSGTYSLSVILGGCTTQKTASIIVASAPQTPIVTNSGPVCSDATATLSTNLQSGAAYYWTGPSGFSAQGREVVLSGFELKAGRYEVVAVIGNCTSSVGVTELTVIQRPTAVAASSNHPFYCTGDTAVLTVISPVGFHYLWQGPGGFSSTARTVQLNNITANALGSYSVVAIAGRCTSEAATVSVQVNPRPVITGVAGNTLVCEGASLQLAANEIVGASYWWVGPNGFSATASQINVPNMTLASAGEYRVTAISQGCSSAWQATTVSLRRAPTRAETPSNVTLCEGGDLRLTAIGEAGARFLWSGPQGFSSTLQNPIVPGVNAQNSGTYSVWVVVNGCTSQPSFSQVFVQPIPNLGPASSNSPVCEGGSLQLSASFLAGASYYWTGPSGFTSTLFNPVLNNVTSAQAGRYNVVAIVNGCTSQTRIVTASILPAPGVISANNSGPICAGGTLQLSSAFVPGASYVWSGPGGYFSAEQNPVISNATTAQSGVYSVTAVVGSCSSSIATTRVTVNPTPGVISAGYNGPICEGEILNLTASFVPTAQYQWYGPNGYTSRAQNPQLSGASIRESGTYSVVAWIGNCSSQMSVVNVVVSPAPPLLTAGSSSPVCEGQTLSLFATPIPGAQYFWKGPDGFSSNEQAPILTEMDAAKAGVYEVSVKLGACSGRPATTSVVVNPTPRALTASSKWLSMRRR